MEIRLDIKLHAGQQEIEDSKARFKVIRAGKRFGKTEWLKFALVKKALEKAGLYWYIAPEEKWAKEIFWDQLVEFCPMAILRGKARKSNLEIPFINGSNLRLKGSDNLNSLRGPEPDGVGFDERAYGEEEVWSRVVRSQLTKKKGFAYFISSPNSRGRNHYTRFCDEAMRREKGGDVQWMFRHKTIYDNPYLERQEIEDLKGSVPGYIWDLEYMAKESEMAGSMYGEFDFDRDVIEMEVKGKRYRGIDHGLDHPFACLWASLDLDNLIIYVYDEYVRGGGVISKNCEVVRQKTGTQDIEWTVIDPSTAKRDAITNKSYIFEYSLNGLHCIPGERSQRGVDLLKMCLERGRVKVHPRCRTLIYELQNVQYGDKTGDDSVDGLKYLVAMICDTVPEFRLMEKKVVGDRVVGLPKDANMYSLFD